MGRGTTEGGGGVTWRGPSPLSAQFFGRRRSPLHHASHGPPPHAGAWGGRLLPNHPRPPRRDVVARAPALAHLRLLDETEGAAVPGIIGGRPAVAEAAALGEAAQK